MDGNGMQPDEEREPVSNPSEPQRPQTKMSFRDYRFDKETWLSVWQQLVDFVKNKLPSDMKKLVSFLKSKLSSTQKKIDNFIEKKLFGEEEQVDSDTATTTNGDQTMAPAMSMEGLEKMVRPEDMEYISDKSAAMLMRTPTGGRLLIYVVFFALISLIIWASVVRLDEITRGMGLVIPSSRLQVVQNLEGGILEKVMVKEGATVKAGQELMLLDDTRFASTFKEGSIEYYGELAKAARLRAEFTGGELSFPGVLQKHPNYIYRETDIYRQRAKKLRSELRVAQEQASQAQMELDSARDQLTFLKSSFELGEDELRLTEPLVDQGIVSRVELIQLRQRVNDLESQKRMTESSIPRLQAGYNEAIARRDEVVELFQADVAQDLKDVEVRLDQLKESNMALEDQVDRTVIRAPMDGIVKKIHVTTIGGVVQPGMNLLEIVPIEDNLLIEAKIPPQDIGFLREGMKAVVKLTAYDFAIYGGLEGYVENISADTIMDDKGESFYMVRIRTDESHVGTAERPLVIIPGMMTNVDIITGDKTLMAYLLKPLLRAKQNALTER
ncbi:HlyD family type I secretion periplasmic adaptor subunit [uncultured Endozoicomonas sp.]|uniref:HlyD family type I secretion periplasmic adaptor subunit n=1 Tax=uncultured Endozoicomonas sp. TaxID=432652 RepID=UPI0026394DCF|nr:HlyD family type I secretion periplasmic adaptor subunit [uncultured Endozoicomonas sp.]